MKWKLKDHTRWCRKFAWVPVLVGSHVVWLEAVEYRVDEYGRDQWRFVLKARAGEAGVNDE